MPLAEAFRKCLSDLVKHCEALQAEADSLQKENSLLQTKLSSFTSLPGYVPEHSTDQPNAPIVKKFVTVRANEADTPESTIESNGHGSTSTDAEPQTDDGGKPGLVKSSSGSVDSKNTCSSENRVTKAFSGSLAVPEKQMVENGCKNGETLAAARLDMLLNPEDPDNDSDNEPLQGFFDAIKVLEGPDGDDQQTVLARYVKGFAFKALTIFAIAGNTIYIGASADHQAKNSFRRVRGELPEENTDWHIAEIVFAIFFSVEVLLRMAADKKSFCVGPDWKWNLFDTFLVLNQIFELIAPVAANLSFMRIFRVFRLVRVVRIVRTVTALKSLRTMVYALMNSFVCLLWAFVMIVLVMFVFGVIIAHAVAGYFDTIDVGNSQDMATATALQSHFGSIFETMVSLFCSITGGNDWMMYAELLRELKYGDFYFLIFAFYISFCLIGVLNVVTGIFVDTAVSTRTQDEVVECFTDDVKRTSEEVRRIFKEADKDRSGTMSFKELNSHLQTPWVKAYFSGLDIDPSEATIIFTLMDTDGSGEVSIDEFVDGTMKLKGHAKNIDVLSLMFDSVRFSLKFNTLCCYIEDQMRDIRNAIAPGSVGAGRLFTMDGNAVSNPNRFSKLKRAPDMNRRPSAIESEVVRSHPLDALRRTASRILQ